MTSLYLKNLREHLNLFATLLSLDSTVMTAVEIATASLKSDRKLMFCGNGGSTADSYHLVAELTYRSTKYKKRLVEMALSKHFSALTCISDDYSCLDVYGPLLCRLLTKINLQQSLCVGGIVTTLKKRHNAPV